MYIKCRDFDVIDHGVCFLILAVGLFMVSAFIAYVIGLFMPIDFKPLMIGIWLVMICIYLIVIGIICKHWITVVAVIIMSFAILYPVITAQVCCSVGFIIGTVICICCCIDKYLHDKYCKDHKNTALCEYDVEDD